MSEHDNLIEFEMTEAQYQKIHKACTPVPLIFNSAGERIGLSEQENAIEAWKELGEEMRFYYSTVIPSEKGEKFFMAKPKEQ